MKHILIFIFLSFCISQLSAQEKHFVFIQSDTKQPFYVSVNGKLFSSTASGYVIIPKLTDGNYNFTIGFAQNAFPEQTFTFALQNKDLGFTLKNFNEKGWGLFNQQTLDVSMASTASSNVVSKALSENTKPAAGMISFDKKKDTTLVAAIKPAEPVMGEAVKSETIVTSAPKTDSLSGATTKSVEPASNSKINTTSVDASAKSENTNEIKKVSEVAGEEGVHLSYVEGPGKTKDTINIIIPSSSTPATSSIAKESTVATSQNKEVSKSVSTGIAQNDSKGDVKFLDIDGLAKSDKVQAEPLAKESRTILENSNCKNIATDEDYLKLRKKMSLETTDDKMINEARKFYRNKCFTTSQIKGLSTLFLSDDARLKFFDASFVSVADASQYTTLQTEFIDPAYVTRFKAMLQ